MKKRIDKLTLLKLKMRYHYTPTRMAKIQKTDDIKCWGECETTGILIHCWWECKMVQILWKTTGWFLIKLNISLPHNPAIMLLGIYLRS